MTGAPAPIAVPLPADLIPATFLERPNRFLVRTPEGGIALFPDAVTARGPRHVRELAGLA